MSMPTSLRKRIGAIALAAVVGVTAVALILGTRAGESTETVAGESPTVAPETSVSGVPEVDYVIDLNTGVMTPLPEAIVRSLGKTDGGVYAQSRYAVSSDGSLLAYVGAGDDASLQIFIAGLDGTGIRQVTHDPTGAMTPAWSPDGTSIAYAGYGTGDVRNLFILDVATGESTQITDGTLDLWSSQFTHDGSSLLYDGGSSRQPELRTVPVTGGKSTLFIGADRGLDDAGNGSLSPDGSLVTYLAGGTFEGHCGPCRFVANVDGTERRILPWRHRPPISSGCYGINPAGAWSPDGNRIVCSDDAGSIYVVDVATGDASDAAEGSGAIWLDGNTLLVEV